VRRRATRRRPPGPGQHLAIKAERPKKRGEASTTVYANEPTDDEVALIESEFVRFGGWDGPGIARGKVPATVWDRRDQSYVWVRRGASEATARAVARVLEVLVPAGDLAALSAGGCARCSPRSPITGSTPPPASG
jgi:hypothetical protein